MKHQVSLPNLSGMKNLEILAKSINGEITKEDIRRSIQKVGLNPANMRKNRKIFAGDAATSRYCTGNHGELDILILDEPFNGLDKMNKKKSAV